MVVRSCRVKYLWVDALCIIQNDRADIDTHVAQMGSVYAKALFTICAMDGTHANAGLPGIGPNTRDVRQDCFTLDGFGLLSMIAEPYSIDGNIGPVWKQRAWTFREELFSKRKLYINSRQMHWKCVETHWAEETSCEAAPLKDKGLGSHNNVYRAVSHLGQIRHPVNFAFALREDAGRRLSFDSDRINALLGTMTAVCDMSGHIFYWVMANHNFSLSWKFEDLARGNSGHELLSPISAYHRIRACHIVTLTQGVVIEVPFPSWSWVGWRVGSYFPLLFEYIELSEAGRMIPEITFYIWQQDTTLRRITDNATACQEDTFADRLKLHDQFYR